MPSAIDFEALQGYLFAHGWTTYAGLWRDPLRLLSYDPTLTEAATIQYDRDEAGTYAHSNQPEDSAKW